MARRARQKTGCVWWKRRWKTDGSRWNWVGECGKTHRRAAWRMTAGKGQRKVTMDLWIGAVMDRFWTSRAIRLKLYKRYQRHVFIAASSLDVRNGRWQKPPKRESSLRRQPDTGKHRALNKAGTSSTRQLNKRIWSKDTSIQKRTSIAPVCNALAVVDGRSRFEYESEM